MQPQKSRDWWSALEHRIRNLPSDELERITKEQNAESERIYAEFKESFSHGRCCFCKKPLETFTSTHSCVHYLLRPKGVKKEHLEQLLNDKGYFRTGSYVRWVANQDKLLVRINDLAEEGDQKALFHWSATFRHIKWTFYCTASDFNGHPNSSTQYPHFHIEIRLGGKVFVKFNDFHARLSEYDIFHLKNNSDTQFPITQSFAPYGSGIQDGISVDPNFVLENSKATDDQEKALFRIQTVVEPKSGQKISGEYLASLYEKSKQTGKPMAYFLQQSEHHVKTYITPMDDIPNKETRSKTR